MLQKTKRPTQRMADKARTRAATIKAATELFNERGYEDVGLRDIAARMGMSTGSIFTNFATKADVFKACFGVKPPTAAEWVGAIKALENLLALREETIAGVCNAGLPSEPERVAQAKAVVDKARAE